MDLPAAPARHSLPSGRSLKSIGPSGGFQGIGSGDRCAADDPNERTSGMPVTRSELLFLCGGALAGVVVAKKYDKIKAKAGPLLAAAGAAAGDAYTAAARRVGERMEAMQD